MVVRARRSAAPPRLVRGRGARGGGPRRPCLHDKLMGRFWNQMNPTLRGFLIIALIALVVVVFQLYTTLAVVAGLLRIAFFLAIAFVIFLWWKSRRADIEAWSDRSRRTFYAAAILIVI